MTRPPHRFERLPMWAQIYIEQLETELSHIKFTAMKIEHNLTRVRYTNDLAEWHYLPDNSYVELFTTNGNIHVHLDILEKYNKDVRLVVSTDDQLIIEPRSSNQIILSRRRF